MRATETTGGVAARRHRSVRPDLEGVELHGATDELAELPAHWLVEIDHLAGRIHADHGEIPLDTVTVLVREAYASMLGARVQSFRAVLAERSVRRRLSGALHVPSH